MTVLENRRVLVVEDEFSQADDMARALAQAGAVVVGPCWDQDEALRALDAAPVDAAVLDINLGSGPTFGVADALRARGVPFVFATGYGTAALPERFSDQARFEKRYEPQQVARLLGRVT